MTRAWAACYWAACCCATVFSVQLFAQTVVVPRSGVIFDPGSHSLRAVNGVAGAATLGQSLAGSTGIATAAVCSPKNFAVVATDVQGAVSIGSVDGSPPAPLPDGLLNYPDGIFLSASCSAALLYSAASNQFQVLTGLPNAPVITSAFSPSFSRISSCALSDDGALVLCIVPSAGVYLLSPLAAPKAVVPLAGGGSVALRNNSDALIADTSANQLLLVPYVTASPSAQVLAGPDQGISSPNAIAYDSVKQLVLVGNGGSGNVGILNLADDTVNFLDCGCQASFSPLENAIFQVSPPTNNSPLLVLDVTSSSPKVLFVASRP